MFDIEESLNNQIFELKQTLPTVYFTEAADPRQLEAICHLTRFIKPVLPSSEEKIRAIINSKLSHLGKSRVEYALSQIVFIDINKNKDLIAEFAEEYVKTEAEAGNRVSMDNAIGAVSDPCLFGILAVKTGYADIVVGGSTYEPVKYFRPMLRYLKKKDVQSEAGFFVLPDENNEDTFSQNIIVFGDVGVNGTMTPEILARIAVDTCTIARNIISEDVLEYIHGAIVSYSNHGSDEGPSPELVKDAAALVPELLNEYIGHDKRYKSIDIKGEVKVNVALSERSAMYYAHDDGEQWTGPANAIVCPNLDMGNLLYHLYATRFPDAKKFSVISGVGFSAVDLARDCTSEDIRLGVKATILNLLKKENWQNTPKDTFFKRYKILAINPGSTSTKISVFEGSSTMYTEELQHSVDDLAEFQGMPATAQFEYRKGIIIDFLKRINFPLENLDAVAGRGGLLHPIKHGTYEVNKKMIEDLKAGVGGDHASNLGALIAAAIAKEAGLKAFIVDPVVVDEAEDKVKVTGIKEIRRFVISHALNQIASARRYAEENETFYEELNVIVAHLGGGISVGAHHKGRYVDVNNALNGEGPFTPQRSGSLPVGQLIELCFSGKYTKDQLKNLNKGSGGLVDLLGTTDLREVESRIENGDEEAKLVFDALAYQVSKEICSLVPAFEGESVNSVILTGGMARSGLLVEAIGRSVQALGCCLTVYPGENEMQALGAGVLRVIQGKESPRVYAP